MSLFYHKVHIQQRERRIRFLCSIFVHCVREAIVYEVYFALAHAHRARIGRYLYIAHWNNVDTHDCWIIFIIAIHTARSSIRLISSSTHFHSRAQCAAHQRSDVSRLCGHVSLRSHIDHIWHRFSLVPKSGSSGFFLKNTSLIQMTLVLISSVRCGEANRSPATADALNATPAYEHAHTDTKLLICFGCLRCERPSKCKTTTSTNDVRIYFTTDAHYLWRKCYRRLNKNNTIFGE